MYELPEINDLLYVALEANHQSRVEGRDGDVLVVAAPSLPGWTSVPAGSEFTLFWQSEHSWLVAPVRMIFSMADPPRWQVRAIGPPERLSRRQFVRGCGGGQVVLAGEVDVTVESIGGAVAVAGGVVDVSEAGMRCRLPGPIANVSPGDLIYVRFEVGHELIEHVGRLMAVRSVTDGEEAVDVVVTYQLPEHLAVKVRRHIFAWQISRRWASQGA